MRIRNIVTAVSEVGPRFAALTTGFAALQRRCQFACPVQQDQYVSLYNCKA
jgi:hypothetical protein